MKKVIRMLLCVLFMLNAAIVANAQDVDEDFEAFMDSFFIEEMESDYMTLHYTLKDWRKMGIDKPDLVIGIATWEDYADSASNYGDVMKEMESFDYDALNDKHKHDYDTLYFYFDAMKKLNEYPYFDFCFSPGQGLIDNLLTNFTEFVFYEKVDIEDYLGVLKSVETFVDGAIEITKKQAAEGYFLTENALQSTLEAIDRFVEKKEDNQLIVIFDNNIDAFKGLTDEERADFKKRNRDIVLNTYIPSYEKARDALVSLRGSRKYGDSVADLPNGKEYYAVLAQLKGSTMGSVQELIDICMDVYMPMIYALSKATGSNDGKVAVTEPTEILDYLKGHIEDFPKGPDVSYTATYLDPSVANSSIVAYYVNPPVNDLSDNVIKINGSNVSDVNELYCSLAHEGYPGHLYQTNWYLSQNPSRARSAVSNIGYSEGWAMYAENYMWSKSGMDAGSAEYNRLLTNVNYLLDTICDLGVNGLGWSMNELRDFIENRMFLSPEIATSLYDFVTKNPGQIVPYGVGLAQFLRLEDNVRAEKGDGFDIVEFHQVLLENGDRPFHVVESDIKAHYGEIDLSVIPSEEFELPEEMTDLMSRDTSGAKAVILAGIVAIAGLSAIVILVLRARKRNR